MYDNISIDFNNLSLNHRTIKEIGNSENECQDPVKSTFQPPVLSGIDFLCDEKNRPDSIYNPIIKTQASNVNVILIESVATNLMKGNLIFNKKIVSGFKSTFRKNPLLRKETMPNAIADKSQDKNEIILDKLVTFCHPTPQLHNDIDSPVSLNTFTPAEKPESDMSTVKIEAFITSLKIYISCKISMINAKLTSFFDHINKRANNLNHREDKHLELLHDSISLLQRELLMKNERVFL